MLTIVDNEEFYEQEKPLSLVDIRSLIVILRQVRFTLFTTFIKAINKPGCKKAVETDARHLLMCQLQNAC